MNIDLSTTYMGLELRNPIIAASSGLTDSVVKIKELDKQGVGAIVLKSIFEEQIIREIDAQGVNNMYGTYQDAENYVSFYTREHNLNNYTQLIQDAKNTVEIPIIASINCISKGEWIDYAKRIAEAGANGIEINLFIMPADAKKTGAEYEQAYFDIANSIKQQIDIPVALKLSSYFSGLANTIVKLSETGISSLVLFNRFYSPDIDLDSEKIVSGNIYSSASDNGNTLRWMSLLHGKVSCSIAASTGIHSWESVIKNIMAGANAVQIASVLYEKGITHVPVMLKEMESWMASKNYNSIKEIIGKLSSAKINNPMMYERAQFMKYFSNHY
jgi:dihydroorotate dehydrogenase (fumarate)